MIMRKPFLLIASEETVEGIKKYRGDYYHEAMLLDFHYHA